MKLFLKNTDLITLCTNRIKKKEREENNETHSSYDRLELNSKVVSTSCRAISQNTENVY